MTDEPVLHGGRLISRDQLVMCSRCPRAMYAVLVRVRTERPSVHFWCEHCDRAPGVDLTEQEDQ